MASNLVQIVDQGRIVDLPLNGRNVLQSMVLGAGISNRGSEGSTVQIDTYGGGSYHVSVSVNGSVALTPQYGRSVVVVNVVTRGRTNELHGSVYEFLRNFNMNAANFFSARAL